MTRIIRSLAAAFSADTEHVSYRFSRGMGPRPAPKSPRS
jgi:hypothetical protein